MNAKLINYKLDDGSIVSAEVYQQPGSTWLNAANKEERTTDLLAACATFQKSVRTIVEGFKTISPQELEIKFGVKLAGNAGWVFAGASAEGNLEVTLKWSSANKDN